MQAVSALGKMGFAANMIFDVGANVGSTVAQLRKTFPAAHIHAFEPISTTFERLQVRHANDPNVNPHRIALSDVKSIAQMRAVPGGLTNRLMERAPPRLPVEMVQTETGDHFCSERNISHIDFLKIDTEGAEVKVLRGFDVMISERRIKFIQVECGTTPDNKFHIGIDWFCAHLRRKGYGLFGLYDACRHPKKTGEIREIWYCNALFLAT